MSFLDNLLDETKAAQFVEQNTEAWHQIRLGRFTASEIYRLMSLPKAEHARKAGKLSEAGYSYVLEKVAETLTGQPKQQGYAFPLVWGMEHEAEAVEFFESKTGKQTTQTGFYPYTDHAGGSPDREVGDDEILEIKCPYDSARQIDYLMLTTESDLKAEFPQYYWQCQANLLFTGRSVCHFATFDPRMKDNEYKMAHLEVRKNEADQQFIIDRIAKAIEEKLKVLTALKP